MFGSKLPVSRKHQRQRMRRAAWLSLGGGAPPIQCVVWDLSDGGCRLAAPHGTKLPAVFILAMGPSPQDHRPCRVVWQRGTYLGVKFIGADEAERLAESLPDAGNRGRYLNNDATSFLSGQPKPAVHHAKSLRPRRRTYGL